MARKELVDYVKQSLDTGYNLDQVRQNLTQSGYSPKDIEEALSESQGTQSGSAGQIGFFKKTKLILIKPKTFFESVKDESDLIHSFNFNSIWTLIFLLIPLIIFTIIYYNSSLKANPSFSMISLLVSSSSIFMAGVIYLILMLYNIFFMPFKLAAYYFVALKWVFKIKTPFTQSYKAFVYPILQLYIFPFVIAILFLIAGFVLGLLDLVDKASIVIIILYAVSGLAFFVYHIYTVTTGLSILNDIPRWKALIVVLFPLLLLAILGLLIYLDVKSSITALTVGAPGLGSLI